jgi:hypothetical protein
MSYEINERKENGRRWEFDFLVGTLKELLFVSLKKL